MAQFDKSLIKILLRSLTPGQQHSTHSLSHCCSSFNGNDNRTRLHKYLNYLCEKGYILRHIPMTKYFKWSITQDGIDILKLLETDPFIN